MVYKDSGAEAKIAALQVVPMRAYMVILPGVENAGGGQQIAFFASRRITKTTTTTHHLSAETQLAV